MAGTLEEYVERVMPEPRHIDANAAAIAEAAGFCGMHSVGLQPSDDSAIDTLGHAALRAALRLFDSRPGMADRRVELFHVAGGACPACSHEHRRLAFALSFEAERRRGGPSCETPSSLCMPHYRALLERSSLGDLRPWARRQLSAAERLNAESAPLERLFAFVAGTPSSSPFAGKLPDAECPVCRSIQQAYAEWTWLARESVRTNAGVAMLLPRCPRHLWDCAGDPDEDLAKAAARHAMDESIAMLTDAVHWLADEEEREKVARNSVWYRRKHPSYALGKRRHIARATRRCAVCERLDVARDRAIGEAVDKIMRTRAAKTPPLCLKHFADTYLLVPTGAPRRSMEAAKMSELRRLLEDRAPWRQVNAALSPIQ